MRATPSARRDRALLADAAVQARQHPLAPWVDYWDLSNRLQHARRSTSSKPSTRAGPAAMSKTGCATTGCWSSAGAATGPTSPRLPALSHERRPRGQLLCAADRSTWPARTCARPRAAPGLPSATLDDGCNLLASTLFAAGLLSDDDAWRKARLSVETNRPRAARAAAGFVSPAAAQAVAELFDNPARYLARKPVQRRRPGRGAGGAGPDAPGGSDPRPRPRNCRTAGSARCRTHLAALAWAAIGQAGGAEAACPRPCPTTQRAWALRATRRQPSASWRPGPTTRWPGRCAPRCAPTARDAERWHAGRRGDRRDERRPSSGTRPGSTGAPARCRPGQGRARGRGRARWRHASCCESIAGADALLRQARAEDLGGTLALPPAPAALTARRTRSRARATRAWSARCS